MCKIHPDPRADLMALALLQHPQHRRDILDGLGWWEACAGRAS